jgi:hypothetical protein
MGQAMPATTWEYHVGEQQLRSFSIPEKQANRFRCGTRL